MGRRQIKTEGTIVHHSVPSHQNNEDITSKLNPPLSSGSREDKGQPPALQGLLVSWMGEECLESLDLGTKYGGQTDKFQTHF